ncbi:MAG TPA: FliH/SctL family protein [Sedimentisphaerales bacterium]|nr:FliH/SctL family protein [Sedimentisphaerales bacterium]
MPETITIGFVRPIFSVVLTDGAEERGTGASGGADERDVPAQQRASLSQACQALGAAVNKINEFQEELFRGHREQIAKLSVEIARKILAQKIGSGDYEIESIVQESLKNVPARQEVVVHLNPEDIGQCERAQQAAGSGIPAGIKLIADPNMGRGECLLETPKGIIASFIDEQIEQIGEALKKVE